MYVRYVHTDAIFFYASLLKQNMDMHEKYQKLRIIIEDMMPDSGNYITIWSDLIPMCVIKTCTFHF